MSLRSFILFIICTLLDRCQGEIYVIKFESQFYFLEFADAPALFGPKLIDGAIRGMLIEPSPPGGCNPLKPAPVNYTNEVGKWVLLVPRYNNHRNCSFEEKMRLAQLAHYDAVIVYNVNSEQLVPMAASNNSGIFIPSVFVSETSGMELKKYVDPDHFVVITGESPFNIETHLLIPFAIVVGICFIVMIVFMIAKFIKDRRRQRRQRLPTSILNKIPTKKFQKGDPYETCAICLDDYVEGEKLRILPCGHVYHTNCIDPWLTKNRRVCPICKRKVFGRGERHTHVDSDSESESDDTTPLINPQNRGTQGGTFAEPEIDFMRRIRLITQQYARIADTTNPVTASDHHSINGDYESSSQGAELDVEPIQEEFRAHVYTADATSESSAEDSRVNVQIV